MKDYEQRSLVAIGKYSFYTLGYQKVQFSTLSTNKDLIERCKKAGFKLGKSYIEGNDNNLTKSSSNDPGLRYILSFNKNDFEMNNLGRSVEPSSKSGSTRFSLNTRSTSKISGMASSISSSSRQDLIFSTKASSIKHDNLKLPQISFHKYPQIESNITRRFQSPISYSSINASHDAELPTIMLPNYYYRSTRKKNNALMDSVIAMDKEILRESQSLEELKASMNENKSLFITKPTSRVRNSVSQTELYGNENFTIAPNKRYLQEEKSPIKSRKMKM
jgi:hypothetical protein